MPRRSTGHRSAATIRAMTDRPSPDLDDPFAWHPEPDLIGYADSASRPAMERLGADTWATALDYLYHDAAGRAMGDPASYTEMRARFFGAGGGPAAAPASPTPV